jgi:hypothetical protein
METTYTLFPLEGSIEDYCNQFKIPFLNDYSDILDAATISGKLVYVELFAAMQPTNEVLYHFVAAPSPAMYLPVDFDHYFQAAMQRSRSRTMMVKVVIIIDPVTPMANAIIC